MADHPYIPPAFSEQTQEAWLIGQMVIGYGELEFETTTLINTVYGDPYLGLRALFRTRGESQRLEIADALLRDKLTNDGHGDKYAKTFTALKHCTKIRNQYAHCHWHRFNGELYFYDFEETAKSRVRAGKIVLKAVNLALCLRQLGYFNFVRYRLIHLQNRYGCMDGIVEGRDQPWPKELLKPNLYNHQKGLADLHKGLGQNSQS